MKLNEQIKLAAEHYAAFGGNGMDSTAYFAFVKGAKYALKLISQEINDEL
jgi:hypothetical protein